MELGTPRQYIQGGIAACFIRSFLESEVCSGAFHPLFYVFLWGEGQVYIKTVQHGNVLCPHPGREQVMAFSQVTAPGELCTGLSNTLTFRKLPRQAVHCAPVSSYGVPGMAKSCVFLEETLKANHVWLCGCCVRYPPNALRCPMLKSSTKPASFSSR